MQLCIERARVIILIIILALLAVMTAMFVYTVLDYREYKKVSNERLEQVLQITGENADHSGIVSYIDTKTGINAAAISELSGKIDADAALTDERIGEIAETVANMTVKEEIVDTGTVMDNKTGLIADDIAVLAETVAAVAENAERNNADIAALAETVAANAVTAEQTAADLAALTETVAVNAATAEQTATGLVSLTETVNENARTTAELTEKVNENDGTELAGLAVLAETVAANAAVTERNATELTALTETVAANAAIAEKTAVDLAALAETVTSDAATAEQMAMDLAALTETVTADAAIADQTAADLTTLTETVNENIEITSDISERLDLLENRMAGYEHRNAITVNVGETLVFGRCEQDGNPGNGPEGITWIVLDVQENRALLISRDVIDQIPYMLSSEETTWEHSYAREWLNDTFINLVFSEQERACIIRTTVNNGDETGYAPFGRSNGSDTADKVFLLSYDEVAKYFKMSQNRAAQPTVTLRNRGIAYDRETGCCTWWLRSAGSKETKNADIYTNGKIHNSPVNSGNVGVRPVVWVDYTADGFYNG